MNLYDVKRHSASAGGYQLRAVVDPFPPWVLERNSTLGTLPAYEAGFILLLLASVYKVPFNIGECIPWVSFWGYKKYVPYLISAQASLRR